MVAPLKRTNLMALEGGQFRQVRGVRRTRPSCGRARLDCRYECTSGTPGFQARLRSPYGVRSDAHRVRSSTRSAGSLHAWRTGAARQAS